MAFTRVGLFGAVAAYLGFAPKLELPPPPVGATLVLADAAVTTIALADALVTTLSIGDAGLTTLAIADALRET